VEVDNHDHARFAIWFCRSFLLIWSCHNGGLNRRMKKRHPFPTAEAGRIIRRCALAEFRERYNQRWIVQRLDYLTPAQSRQQLLALIDAE
jgi:transposase InsO family protein